MTKEFNSVANSAKNLAKMYKSVLELVDVVEEAGNLEQRTIDLKAYVKVLKGNEDEQQTLIKSLTSKRLGLEKDVSVAQEKLHGVRNAAGKEGVDIINKAKEAAEKIRYRATSEMSEKNKKLLFAHKTLKAEMEEMEKQAEEAVEKYKKAKTDMSNLINRVEMG